MPGSRKRFTRWASFLGWCGLGLIGEGFGAGLFVVGGVWLCFFTVKCDTFLLVWGKRVDFCG